MGLVGGGAEMMLDEGVFIQLKSWDVEIEGDGKDMEGKKEWHELRYSCTKESGIFAICWREDMIWAQQER